MAKVTFEFTRDFTKTVDTGGVMEGIGCRVTVEGSDNLVCGPEDALAYIVASMGKSIIRLAGEELTSQMKKHGAEAFTQFMEAQKH